MTVLGAVVLVLLVGVVGVVDHVCGALAMYVVLPFPSRLGCLFLHLLRSTIRVCALINLAVSEPIGLEIEAAADTYLYAIVFTGLMYFIAGSFAWLLRAWKIGQLEMLAAEQGTTVDQVDAVQQSVVLDRVTSKEVRAQRSTLVYRLFAFKRV